MRSQSAPEEPGRIAGGEESAETALGMSTRGGDDAATLVAGRGENESTVQQQRWWRQAVVNGAYFPLTLHWSSEEGLLGDRWVGLLGMLAGEVTLRQAWRETA